MGNGVPGLSKTSVEGGVLRQRPAARQPDDAQTATKASWTARNVIAIGSNVGKHSCVGNRIRFGGESPPDQLHGGSSEGRLVRLAAPEPKNAQGHEEQAWQNDERELNRRLKQEKESFHGVGCELMKEDCYR